MLNQKSGFILIESLFALVLLQLNIILTSKLEIGLLSSYGYSKKSEHNLAQIKNEIERIKANEEKQKRCITAHKRSKVIFLTCKINNESFIILK